jgi:hypothetical protein
VSGRPGEHGGPPAVSFGVPTFFPFFLSPPVLYQNVPFDDRQRQRVSVVETVNAMIAPRGPGSRRVEDTQLSGRRV